MFFCGNLTASRNRDKKQVASARGKYFRKKHCNGKPDGAAGEADVSLCWSIDAFLRHLEAPPLEPRRLAQIKKRSVSLQLTEKTRSSYCIYNKLHSCPSTDRYTTITNGTIITKNLLSIHIFFMFNILQQQRHPQIWKLPVWKPKCGRNNFTVSERNTPWLHRVESAPSPARAPFPPTVDNSVPECWKKNP